MWSTFADAPIKLSCGIWAKSLRSITPICLLIWTLQSDILRLLSTDRPKTYDIAFSGQFLITNTIWFASIARKLLYFEKNTGIRFLSDNRTESEANCLVTTSAIFHKPQPFKIRSNLSIAYIHPSVDTSMKGRQSDLVADPTQILPICSFFATFFLNRARRLATFYPRCCVRLRGPRE